METRGEQNRQRILRAAADLFYHQGYNATSFTDIAQAADIPRGNFYYYFKTKDEILESVIEMRLEWVREQLKEWTARHTDPRERMCELPGMLLDEADNVVRYGCPLGTLNAELGKTHHILQSAASRLFSDIADWLTGQFHELGYNNESRHTALHVLSRIQGATVIANACTDRGFLFREMHDIQDWIRKQSWNTRQ
ncbi:MAG: TetR/AcrR family transcriptional regulator [Gammaproteobacteria bacterium]|jgi:AcrR family transcriptional regulator